MRALPGIGDYTAGAIASICFEAPAAAVDGNVLRVILPADGLRRLPGRCARAAAHRRRTERSLPRGALRRFHAGTHGAGRDRLPAERRTAVRRLPAALTRCDGPRCRGRSRQAIPVKAAKKPRRHRGSAPCSCCSCGDRLAVCKRPDPRPAGGAVAAAGRAAATLETVQEALRTGAGSGACARPVSTKRPDRTHIFTHVQWDLTRRLARLCASRTRRSSPGPMSRRAAARARPAHALTGSFCHERTCKRNAKTAYTEAYQQMRRSLTFMVRQARTVRRGRDPCSGI